MGKIRHIAIQVPDLEKAAAFYEGVFEPQARQQGRSPIGNAISLSDGIMNLTLLHFPEGTKGGKGGPDWAGLHHIGFIVEDEKATEEKIKKHGGEFFMQLPSYPGVDAEKKYKDINGIVFDVVRARLAPVQRELMRIVAVKEQTIRLASAARNSSISLRRDDGKRDRGAYGRGKNGKPLVGLAFDSIGRYGHGALAARALHPAAARRRSGRLCGRQWRHRSRIGPGPC